MAGGDVVSDVAREAGDVIVLDSSMAAVVECVEAGRLVSVNMRKVIAYTLAHAVPELLPVFLNLVFDIPIMLPGLCVLVVDIFTEQLSAISLSYEAPELSLMSENPRNLESEHLVDRALILYCYCLVAYEQTAAIDAEAEPHVSATSGFPPRRSFKSSAFAEKHSLKPVAALTFLCAWDELVPELAKKLAPPA